MKKIFEWPLTTRALIIGLICLATFYLAYSWDIVDLRAQLDTAQQQENSLKQQLELIFTKQRAVENEISQFSKLQILLNDWKRKIIPHSELPELLNAILKLGANNQLRFNQFNPGAEVNEGPYFKIPIKVVAIGGYHQLANFISEVASMSWIVVVGDFTISPAGKTENPADATKPISENTTPDLLSAELTLMVYQVSSGSGSSSSSTSTNTSGTSSGKNNTEQKKP